MIESSPAGTHDLLNTVRRHLRGWRGITTLAGIAIVAGLAFNWSWLVAAGIAPVLLSFLPCAGMCALGLCMNRMGGRSCSTGTSVRPASQASSADNTPTPVREISSVIQPHTMRRIRRSLSSRRRPGNRKSNRKGD